MLKLIFPEILYHGKLSEHHTVKAQLLPLARAHCRNNPEGWVHDVLTTMFSDEAIDYSLFMQQFQSNIREFCAEVGSLKKDVQVQLAGIWMNLYRVGHAQEVHHHVRASTNLSFIYYLNYNPEKDAPTQFFNPNFAAYAASDMHKVLNVAQYGIDDYNTVPNVAEGDVLIFPSHLRHTVGLQRHPTERCTVSGNFMVS